MGVADRMIQNKITYRTRDQFARFFGGPGLVDPGVVRVEGWRPDPGTAIAAGTAERSALWGAVGRKG